MYTFLVLGLIPGTNLQITFKTWLDLVGLIIVALLSYKLHNDHLARLPLARRPLHASQLHRRLA